MVDMILRASGLYFLADGSLLISRKKTKRENHTKMHGTKK